MLRKVTLSCIVVHRFEVDHIIQRNIGTHLVIHRAKPLSYVMFASEFFCHAAEQMNQKIPLHATVTEKRHSERDFFSTHLV